MLRKLLALGAGLTVALVGSTLTPAHAEEIAASVTGGVKVNQGTCNTGDAEYGSQVPAETGQLQLFEDTVINGLFETNGVDYVGPMGMETVVKACLVTEIGFNTQDLPVIGEFLGDHEVPGVAHGNLNSAVFKTEAADAGTDPATGDAVCLVGTLLAGGEFNTVGAQATAAISATWNVYAANAAGNCGAGRGTTSLGSGSASLTARVVAIPLADITGDHDNFRNEVEGIVTAH